MGVEQDQTLVIEEIYAARRRSESAALAQLQRTSFDGGLLSTSKTGVMQVVWELFTPAYTCPTRLVPSVPKHVTSGSNPAPPSVTVEARGMLFILWHTTRRMCDQSPRWRGLQREV